MKNDQIEVKKGTIVICPEKFAVEIGENFYLGVCNPHLEQQVKSHFCMGSVDVFPVFVVFIESQPGDLMKIKGIWN